MLGSHLSIAGSMCNALAAAVSLGMDTVQVFTKNQQQWKAPPLDPGAAAEWLAEVRRLGWHTGGPGDARRPAGESGRIVAHASYLINLASPDDELWEKSIGLMRVELERCEALGIPYLVHHPGSPTGAGAEFGMRRIAEAYARLLRETAGFGVVSCLENTVGAGSTLGGTFEELGRLRALIVEAAGEPGRVAFCFDTCHAHAAGYDLSSVESADAALRAFDSACGLGQVRAVHVNDSKGKLGSRRDLHEHIGEGEIGRGGRLSSCGFAAVMNLPAWRGVPKILETPKGDNADGTPYDALNLSRLRQLAGAETPIKLRPRPGAVGTAARGSGGARGAGRARPGRVRRG